jgi:hypothetical protein
MDDRRLDEWMRWQGSRSGRLSWMLPTPARITVGIGSLMTIVAGFMPWAEGQAPAHSGFEPVFFSGLGGAGDGVVLLLTSLGAGLLTLHRTPATSRVRTVRLLPSILVALAALTWINGYRAALLEIAAWERRGGTGGIAPGMWIAAAGIGLMAVGTVVLLPEVIRWRREAGDPSDVVTVGVRDVAEVVGGIAGVLLGGWAGVVGAIALLGPTLVGSIALGVIFGGLLGAYAGAWAGRTIVDRLSPRKDAADNVGRHGPRP